MSYNKEVWHPEASIQRLRDRHHSLMSQWEPIIRNLVIQPVNQENVIDTFQRIALAVMRRKQFSCKTNSTLLIEMITFIFSVLHSQNVYRDLPYAINRALYIRFFAIFDSNLENFHDSWKSKEDLFVAVSKFLSSVCIGDFFIINDLGLKRGAKSLRNAVSSKIHNPDQTSSNKQSVMSQRDNEEVNELAKFPLTQESVSEAVFHTENFSFSYDQNVRSVLQKRKLPQTTIGASKRKPSELYFSKELSQSNPHRNCEVLEGSLSNPIDLNDHDFQNVRENPKRIRISSKNLARSIHNSHSTKCVFSHLCICIFFTSFSKCSSLD